MGYIIHEPFHIVLLKYGFRYGMEKKNTHISKVILVGYAEVFSLISVEIKWLTNGRLPKDRMDLSYSVQ